MQNFIDVCYLTIRAGNGGNGFKSFMKYKILRGKPDGGNGGKGGNVYLISDHNYNNLNHLIINKSNIFCAQNGQSGGKNFKCGSNGSNLYIKVPIGTKIFYRYGSKKLIFDFIKNNTSFLIANGGIGGLGNSYFKNSYNRSFKKITYGKNGDSISIKLILCMSANVALIGLSNVGKSSLNNILIEYKNSKVHKYKFSTIRPILSHLYRNKISILDSPPLFCDRKFNYKFKYNFLQHIERTSLILHVIDVNDFILYKDNFSLYFLNFFNLLNLYNKNFLLKDIWLIVNKFDLLDRKYKKIFFYFMKEFKNKKTFFYKKIYYISCKYHKSVNKLKYDVKRFFF